MTSTELQATDATRMEANQRLTSTGGAPSISEWTSNLYIARTIQQCLHDLEDIDSTAATTKLYRILTKGLMGAARMRLPRHLHPQAEEVVQETLSRLWSYPTYNAETHPQRTNHTAYILRVLENVIADFVKAQRTEGDPVPGHELLALPGNRRIDLIETEQEYATRRNTERNRLWRSGDVSRGL
jgi:DNA-directed RNA polymerase specialized sigma24 family protein